MKITIIIPARYNSTRFQGKPLADICGRPMIWWVYRQVKHIGGLDCVIATDDTRIADVCEKYNLKFVMTSETCKTSTNRIHEASDMIESDLYVCVNGDEPLINPAVIKKVAEGYNCNEDFYVCNAMAEIESPAECIDFTQIKVVTDVNNNALYMSRSPFPYPKARLDFKYYKHVGVVAYTKKALDFYAGTSKGKNESIEDIDLLRFIENRQNVKMVEVKAESLSVDTPKDLEVVRKVIQEKITNREIVID